MVGGDDAAVKVGGWISSAYVDRLRVEVTSPFRVFSILHFTSCWFLCIYYCYRVMHTSNTEMLL